MVVWHTRVFGMKRMCAAVSQLQMLTVLRVLAQAMSAHGTSVWLLFACFKQLSAPPPAGLTGGEVPVEQQYVGTYLPCCSRDWLQRIMWKRRRATIAASRRKGTLDAT